jgi:hypothetical protein
MPVLKTNTMPVNAARSGTRLRPGYRYRRCTTGKSGSIRSHKPSLTKGLAIDTVYDNTTPKPLSVRQSKGRPILRIKELNAGIRDDTLRTDVTAAEEHLARHHDILFAWSGSLAVYRWSGPESLINQHIFKIIPEGYPPWFVYQWVRRHMPEFRAIARDKATTMGHIQRRHLSEARVTLPDSDTLARMSDLLEPLDRWQGILASEIASLAATRDALLPKLISGETRVPDTTDSEEVIGPAAGHLAGVKT